jgi:hypothetical protein
MKHILFVITKVAFASLLLALSFQVTNINHTNSILSLNYIDLYVFFSPILVSYSSMRHQISLLLFSLCLWYTLTHSFNFLTCILDDKLEWCIQVFMEYHTTV